MNESYLITKIMKSNKLLQYIIKALKYHKVIFSGSLKIIC